MAEYGSCGKFDGSDTVKMAIKGNKFNATVHPNSETVDKLSGTFTDQRVSGALTSTVTTGGIHPTTCHSGRVTFNAKLRTAVAARRAAGPRGRLHGGPSDRESELSNRSSVSRPSASGQRSDLGFDSLSPRDCLSELGWGVKGLLCLCACGRGVCLCEGVARRVMDDRAEGGRMMVGLAPWTPCLIWVRDCRCWRSVT